MLVWRGWGIIVPILGLIALSLFDMLYEEAHLEFLKESSTRHFCRFALSLILGIIVWKLGVRLNKNQNFYSQKTGKFNRRDILEVGAIENTNVFGIEHSPSHSFMFVKLQYWAVLFGVLAIVSLLFGII